MFSAKCLVYCLDFANSFDDILLYFLYVCCVKSLFFIVGDLWSVNCRNITGVLENLVCFRHCSTLCFYAVDLNAFSIS